MEYAENAKRKRNMEVVGHTRRAVEYMIDADGFKSKHKRYIAKTAKEIEHAGIYIEIRKGWQMFRFQGKEIKAKILREWS